MKPLAPSDGQYPSDFVMASGDSGLAVYVGTFSGAVEAWGWNAETSEWGLRFSTRLFSKPVRRLGLFRDGKHLVAASADGRILVLTEGGKVVKKLGQLKTPDGDAAEISLICLMEAEESSPVDFAIAIGDDLGNVYIAKAVPDADTLQVLMTVQEQDDSITGMVYQAHKKTLVASSGDGTIVVVDTKKLKIAAHSASLDDEITSVALDSQNNVLCGTGLGALVKYKWGYWGKVGNRIKPKVHEGASISCIIPDADSDGLVITATASGTIRRLNVGSAATEIIGHIDDSIECIRQVSFPTGSLIASIATNEANVVFFAPHQDRGSVGQEAAGPKRPKKARTDTAKEVDKVALESFFKDL